MKIKIHRGENSKINYIIKGCKPFPKNKSDKKIEKLYRNDALKIYQLLIGYLPYGVFCELREIFEMRRLRD